jgi:two-component system, OmpR family, response regulator QseB
MSHLLHRVTSTFFRFAGLMMHLLLVEDDLDLGNGLLLALTMRGFTCEWVRTAYAAKGKEVGAGGPFSCAVLDLGLPDGDGIEVLSSWRQRGADLPVIVLTARDALRSKILGLNSGADDYLIKPIDSDELVARVNALIRRYSGQASPVWAVGALEISLKRREIRKLGQLVDLSRMEFEFVIALAQSAGQVVSKNRLASLLAPPGEPLEFNALEVHVHNLRKKLGADFIKTVRGVGYRIDA